jgi:hypothetical protein
LSEEVEVTPDLLAYLAKLPRAKRARYYKAIGQVEWERCRDDLLYWMDSSQHSVLGPYVYTKDQKPLYTCHICNDRATYYFDARHRHLEFRHEIHSKSDGETSGYFSELNTTRAFTMFPYIQPIVEWWLREKIFLLEKSRDMVATWTVVIMYTWDLLFHPGRQIIFQSDDAGKTLDLVSRADFVYRHQPKFLKVHPAEFAIGAAKSGIMRVPTLEGELLGFPQGADQIRQYHPTGIFQDEMAFQIKAGEAFMAAKPAIQAGGRFTGVSSANPGFFYAAARDNLDIV